MPASDSSKAYPAPTELSGSRLCQRANRRDCQVNRLKIWLGLPARARIAPVERNFLVRRGEIDLIMYDRQDLVFVEVKYRHSNRVGNTEEAITGAKLTRLRTAASRFLQQRQTMS
jgi:hypothetical protein